MKRVVTFAALVLAASLAFSEVPVESPTWSDYSYYQFTPEKLPNPQNITRARIDYQADGKTVRQIRLVFRLDNQYPTVAFLVPDPAALIDAEPGREMAISVYADEHLIETFDTESFREYNKRLVLTHANELQEAFAHRQNPESEWPETELSTSQSQSPGFSRSEIEMAAAKASDPCESACTSTWLSCYQGCGGSDPCMARCDRNWERCLSNCPNADVDYDGVVNQYDNCLWTANANQANCDGDAEGDVCDDLNATYVYVGGYDTCMTDKDSHFFYIDFEHHVERRQRDVSSCGAPDRYTRSIREDNWCVNISDWDCCMGLDDSIFAVGDSPSHWCSASVRNRDYCH